MASTPGSRSSSGACDRDKQTIHSILPPSPSTGRFTDRSGSDPDRDSDSDNNDRDEVTLAYQTIWDSFCGLPTRDAYPAFSLPDSAYDRLCRRISTHAGLRSYFEQSLRKDWNAETGVLILRLMPTPMHEYFQDFLIDTIKKELDRAVAEYPSLQRFRDRIQSGAHTSFGDSAQFTKSPDGQFSYDGVPHPQLVIEIAYSEGERRATEKSHEYPTEVPGKVNGVLLVDIHYVPKTKRRTQTYSHSASLSLWTTAKLGGVVTIQRTVNAASFRHAGQALAGELVLPFEIFISADQRDRLPVRNLKLHLSYGILSDFITRAEQRQSLADATPSPPSPVEKIKFVDEHGDVMSETAYVPRAKRREGNPQLDIPRRTRSMSRPRRSPRLHSTGNVRDT
ncbi:hypothetical protein F5Y08DRAFT_321863 [Xylaria arbuscula]|nr:hypothetical protein F5Y08DRAFT_321863 [Xylaria arbuscula]